MGDCVNMSYVVVKKCHVSWQESGTAPVTGTAFIRPSGEIRRWRRSSKAQADRTYSALKPGRNLKMRLSAQLASSHPATRKQRRVIRATQARPRGGLHNRGKAHKRHGFDRGNFVIAT